MNPLDAEDLAAIAERVRNGEQVKLYLISRYTSHRIHITTLTRAGILVDDDPGPIRDWERALLHTDGAFYWFTNYWHAYACQLKQRVSNETS